MSGILSLRSKYFLPIIKNMLLDKEFEPGFRKRIFQKVERIRKEIFHADRTDLVKPRLS